ncbi:hypothetical protein NUKP71_37080 [Klebsiella quasipneumoniae]|nr:hypothetical protein NUKP71_37080 [Klebsiella quasipneumoniae]
MRIKKAPTEISVPPFDISGVAYLLHGTTLDDNRHWLESTRRTVEAMVKDKLLESCQIREERSIILGDTATATVVRYGLPGTVSVVRDTKVLITP